MAQAVAKLKELLPKSTRPLSHLRVVSDGTQLVVRTTDGSFEAGSGQMLLDFNVGSLREDVVRVLRPKPSPERAKSAYELYTRASELDENPHSLDEAQELYQQAIALDPYLAIAYTNLGNIYFRKGNQSEALRLYQHALSLDPSQSEAHYNIGYVMLERAMPANAVSHFEKAVEADPCFSDAVFNLAMTLEQLGHNSRAKKYWKRYVELEPVGTWTAIARKHLSK